MTKTALDLALLRGEHEVLRDANYEEVRVHLTPWLEGAATDPATYHDDKLMGHGVKWGRSGRTDVDWIALTWLRSAPVTAERVAAVLTFLAGVWTACRGPIPAERVEALLRAYHQVPAPEDYLRYGLLMALSNALVTGVDDPGPARKRVEDLGDDDWPPGTGPLIAGLVSRALD